MAYKVVPKIDAEALWLRLFWFTRLRWAIPIVSWVMTATAAIWVKNLLVTSSGMGWVFLALMTSNLIYTKLLERWRANPEAHFRKLQRMAHFQVVGDLLAQSATIHFSGGPNSLYWPYYALTVLVASLFFANRKVLFAYAMTAILFFQAVCLVHGADWRTPVIAALAILLALIVFIGAFVNHQIARSHDQALEVERLQGEKATVEEIARRKSEILSVVSHELCNPLAALRGLVYLAKTKQQGQDIQPLVRIDAQVDRLARLVNDLYDFSSLQAGHFRCDRRERDLAVLVVEVAERFRVLYPRAQLTVKVPGNLEASFDMQRIDQLLTNLISNAIKYAGDDAQVEIEAGYEERTEQVVISVGDNGPGIPEEKLLHIFEPFQRLDASFSPTKGLGIGLALARRIAILHGGTLWAESKVGAGTKFHIRFSRQFSPGAHVAHAQTVL